MTLGISQWTGHQGRISSNIWGAVPSWGSTWGRFLTILCLYFCHYELQFIQHLAGAKLILKFCFIALLPDPSTRCNARWSPPLSGSKSGRGYPLSSPIILGSMCRYNGRISHTALKDLSLKLLFIKCFLVPVWYSWCEVLRSIELVVQIWAKNRLMKRKDWSVKIH